MKTLRIITEHIITYYYIENNQLNTVEFTDSTCKISNINGRENEYNTYSYEYVSAEYASSHLASPEHSDLDAILAYVNSDKSQCIVFWVQGNANGEYTFVTASGAVATKDVLTISDVTGDPKDYYGTYKYETLYVTLNEDGTAVMDLGEGASSYLYMYGDAGYLKTWFNKNYDKGIIVFVEGSSKAYIFNYQDGVLILQDTYTFTK